MDQRIKSIVSESVRVKEEAFRQNMEKIQSAVAMITDCFKDGRKLLICGNGGSAADSQHIAAEFVGRFQKERKALAAISLTTDTSILTCLSNDYQFDCVFSRQVEALGERGDVFLGLSTSGNSKNVVQAARAARSKGMRTIAMTGEGGGLLAEAVELCLAVPSKVTARVQESHSTIAHVICELVEEQFA